MDCFKTEQESFWAGEFGDEYIARNQSFQLRSANLHFFSKILARTGLISSALELGANLGLNMLALQTLVPGIKLAAVEINEKAVNQLRNIPNVDVYHQSILDFKSNYTYEFVFTKGVLIHLNQEWLKRTYELMYSSSNRYICIAEYYNPVPVEILYRSHCGKLFKRDFAGELMDTFHGLRLIDYGFFYHRDPMFPQDDITWFLMEKQVSL